MARLSELAQGRDNNLNLIRAVAAVAVLVSHAVPIALGSTPAEPLEVALGVSLGTLAVMIFFVISGFLVTQSFERSTSLSRFINARCLRIFPGLIVSLVFVALVLGPLVTRLPVAGYLGDPDTALFMLRNTLLVPETYTLPGVFEGQPIEAVVGSIWTLRHEVGCYALVFVLGLAGLYRAPWVFVAVAVIWIVLLWPAVLLSGVELPGILHAFMKLSVPFWVGMLFYALRDRLVLSFWGMVATAVLAWLARDTVFHQAALSLAAGYITFWLAYVPGGVVRAYNRLGDYSYGIYIYAFPIQGWAVWAFGPQTALENILYALPPTILLSVLSWHLVEHPALGLLKRQRPVMAPAEG